MKGKMALFGVGGLLSDEDFNKALNSGYVEFVGAGKAFLLNKDLGILLKEGKGDKIDLEFDADDPKRYALPEMFWVRFSKIKVGFHLSKKNKFGDI